MLDYDWWLLPVYRVAKVYSAVLNAFGAAGPVPEGMSATVALRVRRLGHMHDVVRAGLEKEIARFNEENHYRPPYWRLVRFAQAVAEAEGMP